jgi:hypothetical protein
MSKKKRSTKRNVPKCRRNNQTIVVVNITLTKEKKQIEKGVGFVLAYLVGKVFDLILKHYFPGLF